MKRLCIIVEGQTEQEFVKNMIAPYFANFDIYDVRPFLITTSKTQKGGFVNYQHLKNDINRFLKHESDIIVTTIVDFFKIPNNVPSYNDCLKNNATVFDKVECLEDAIAKDISDNRFIPFIILHEFEALLFSSNKGFEYCFDKKTSKLTQKIIIEFENPELINDNPQTAPSKRLLSIARNYDKILFGNLIALELGIDTIMKKCKHFDKWIYKIKEKIIEIVHITLLYDNSRHKYKK
jgi:hypothetical protein